MERDTELAEGWRQEWDLLLNILTNNLKSHEHMTDTKLNLKIKKMNSASTWYKNEQANKWVFFEFSFHLLLSSFGGFPGSSVVKSTCQSRKNKKCEFDPWVRKIPWRRKWQLTLVFLPGKFYGQRSLAGYSSCRHKESRLSWATEYIHTCFWTLCSKLCVSKLRVSWIWE